MSNKPAFDTYKDSYVGAVQDSVAFSGLAYDYFLRSKAAVLRRLLAERLPGVAAPSLLDVGCGIGALHPLLKPLFERIHGVDVSSACVARARIDNPSASYDTYDGSRLPLADGAFDFVTAICVAHHVPLADRASFFSELRRVARPGGMVCVIEHNPFNPVTRLSVMRCEFDQDAILLRRSDTAKWLRASGLRAVASRYFVFLPSTASWALSIERGLAALPLGAQYATFGRA